MRTSTEKLWGRLDAAATGSGRLSGTARVDCRYALRKLSATNSYTVSTVRYTATQITTILLHSISVNNIIDPTKTSLGDGSYLSSIFVRGGGGVFYKEFCKNMLLFLKNCIFFM